MLDDKEKVMRSSGTTQTEKILAKICEKKKTYKIGRNEKCPCKSGKKYKKCCLEQVMGRNL